MRTVSFGKSSCFRLFSVLAVVLLVLAMAAGATLAATKDRTPPVGSIVINNGAQYTNSRQVSLGLMASDNSGKAVSMALSNDGRSWPRWEKLVTKKSWNLTDKDGTKAVYVKFRDASKNTSKTYSATIVLDRVTPRVTDVQIETSPGQARITWRTSEPAFCSVTIRRLGVVFRSLDLTTAATATAYQTEHEVVINDLRPNDAYTATIQATDQAANIGRSSEFEFVARLSDRVAPKGSIAINGGADYTTSTEVTLDLEAYDDVPGQLYYSLSQNSSTWEGWMPLEKERRYRLTPGDGERRMYVRFRDESGNVSSTYSDSITVDTAAPQVFGFKMDVLDYDSVRLSWQTNEPAYCTTQYGTSLQSLSRPQDVLSSQFTTAHEAVINGLRPGASYNLAIQARDRAGNQARAFEQVIVVPGRDTTPPTGSLRINNGAKTTNSRNVTLGLSAADSETGVAQMQFSNDGWSWSPWEAYGATRAWTLEQGDGMKTVYARFKDGAGNVSSGFTAAIEVDTKDPGIYDVRVETVGINSVRISWRTNEPAFCSVEYYFQSTFMTRRVDSTSAGRYATDHEVTISAVLPATEYHFRIEAVDEAGNRGRYEDTFQLRQRDTTPPQGRLILNNGNEYTNDRQVAARVEAQDDRSSRDRIEYQLSSDGYRWNNWAPSTNATTWTLDAGDGTKTVYVRFRDEAGNTTSAARETIYLDTRAPNIGNVNVEIIERGSARISWRTDEPTACVVIIGTNRLQSRNGGYETDHSVLVTGLLPTTYRFTVEAADRAGNRDSFGGEFRMTSGDSTPPSGSIRINNGDAYTDRQQVNVQLNANDDRSGRIEYQLSNDGRAWSNWATVSSSVPWLLVPGDGTKVIYAHFRDEAGNVSSTISDQIVLDTRAPRIYDVNITNVSPTEVRINWRTDEPASCVLVFGASRPQSRGNDYETDHSVVLSGLSRSQEYRFSIEAADRAGNRESYAGQFRTMAGDSAPPSGTLRINNGAQYTNQAQVTLQLGAKDDQSNRIQFQVSNDGRNWSTWAALTSSMPWMLPQGDGTKVVYVRFRDEAENVSQPISDQIVLDTRDPRILDVDVTNVSATEVRIRWRSDEPTFGVIVITGVRTATPLSHKEEYTTDHTTVLNGLNAGATYRFQINARDQAGNNASYDGTFQTGNADSTAPSGRIQFAGNARVTKDRKVKVELTASDNGGDRVEYQLSNDGSNWSPWDRLTPSVQWTLTDGDGVKTVYARFRDAAGNISDPISAQITLDTKDPKDSKGPRISNVTVEILDKTSVKIRWKTDEPALGEVHFWYMVTTHSGNDVRRETVKEQVGPYKTEHEVIIAGLQEERGYKFEIVAWDEAGNKYTSPESIFQIQ